MMTSVLALSRCDGGSHSMHRKAGTCGGQTLGGFPLWVTGWQPMCPGGGTRAPHDRWQLLQQRAEPGCEL